MGRGFSPGKQIRPGTMPWPFVFLDRVVLLLLAGHRHAALGAAEDPVIAIPSAESSPANVQACVLQLEVQLPIGHPEVRAAPC